MTKPRIGSGGTGVQQRASFTQTSPTPRTTTPESENLVLATCVGMLTSVMSSSVLSLPPRLSTSFSMTDWADV
ncbi:hypothetical protein AHiyo4_26140 [Arthrobacter sp. Hiyo4]|nr:hypothetical protein AHiyo4_26140 [Arthrobacter sp. Hiyo4]